MQIIYNIMYYVYHSKDELLKSLESSLQKNTCNYNLNCKIQVASE
jgi:hypothetical protein